MVVDGFWFWFWFGLDYWFKFVGQFPCPLWDSNPGPLWLPFHLIGWFDVLVRFWDESLWFLVKVVRQPFGSCGLRGNPQSHPL
jgi:hypothetical protein